MTKGSIDFIVPKVKEFWESDDAIDFMTKFAYLYNGYYVPTKIDNDLDYNKKCHEPKRPKQVELMHDPLVDVIFGNITPEEALETIKKQFINHEYPVAKSKDDESSEPF